jgi:hypothetical protein
MSFYFLCSTKPNFQFPVPQLDKVQKYILGQNYFEAISFIFSSLIANKVWKLVFNLIHKGVSVGPNLCKYNRTLLEQFIKFLIYQYNESVGCAGATVIDSTPALTLHINES